MRNKLDIKLRFNILTMIIYIVGIILLLQLFNLQIINGAEYRSQSNTRLTRESVLEAARGSILDSSGNVLATSDMGFSINLYKSKVDNNTLNNNILNIINVLESNGDKYVDNFPIKISPFEYTLTSEESIKKWKTENKIKEETTVEEAFYEFKEKYKIENDNIEDIRKIIVIRYEVAQKGYSSTKAVEISDNISLESALVFNEQSMSFPGINIVVQPIRKYVSDTLGAHIIGNIGKINKNELEKVDERYDLNDYIGKMGIEYVFENYLKGQNGTKQIDMSVDGTVTGEYVTTEAIEGSDVVLTIDANLQKVVEEALEANIKKIASGGFSQRYDTNSGAAVVMNVKTGEILAMASYPTYNPQDFVGGINTEMWNVYNTDINKPLRNKAIQDAYAPGSIFKMVTAIAALESGTITTRDRINDTGVYPKYTNPVCWYYTSFHRGHGSLNVSDAIKHSCNYFFYEVGDRMGIDTLEKYSRFFGLGNKTGVELPSETSGVVASKSAKAEKTNGQPWYPGETLSAVIGQSYNSFSPLQMTRYTSMLANGGNRIKPTVIKTIINADGSEVSKEEIAKFSDEKLGITPDGIDDMDINDQNLRNILEGMKSVTSETGGTAYNIFKNFNIEVGGKTGSAEAPGNKVNAWFSGFAPFDNPEIAVVVFVENGGHGNYSAEAVRDIMAQYFGMNSNQVYEDMTAIPDVELSR